jgi:hypothetical protein
MSYDLCEVNIEVVELGFLPQVGESPWTDVPSIRVEKFSKIY